MNEPMSHYVVFSRAKNELQVCAHPDGPRMTLGEDHDVPDENVPDDTSRSFSTVDARGGRLYVIDTSRFLDALEELHPGCWRAAINHVLDNP